MRTVNWGEEKSSCLQKGANLSLLFPLRCVLQNNATMKFNLASCLILPGLEAIAAKTLFARTLPDTSLKAYWLILTILHITILIFYNGFLYPFFLSPLRNLPQPPGFIPLFGHGRLFLKQQQMGRNWQLQTMTSVPNNGIILRRGFLHTTKLLLTTPEALADVLVHKSYDFEKPHRVVNFLKRFLGEGLLMSEGEEHAWQRKRIMPAFHFRHIKQLYPVFWEKSMHFCAVVKKDLAAQPNGVLDICYYATRVTLDVIGLAGMGRDIGALQNKDDELTKNYQEILEPTREKVLYYLTNAILPPWLVSKIPWRLHERVRVTTGNLRRICSEFVAERKMKIKCEKGDSQEGRDILSIMIRGNDLSDKNLVEQLLTFIAAGLVLLNSTLLSCKANQGSHDSTTSALTWAAYLLAQHPAIQTRLRSEVHTYLPNPGVLSDVGFDVARLLESMPYLNCVCNEVLRLYPPVPLTSRVAIRDTTVCGQVIPSGTMLWIVPWAINRNRNLWGPNAEDFVPERWMDTETGRATMNGGAESNYSFLTFLHGPRGCIGERFARAEMRALVAAFVGNFEMDMADPKERVIVSGAITSKPRNGMKLKLKSLEWGP
jgi:cytochrome P450